MVIQCIAYDTVFPYFKTNKFKVIKFNVNWYPAIVFTEVRYSLAIMLEYPSFMACINV
jgi:hypothetical protein